MEHKPMFQLFLRARAHNLFRGRPHDRKFKVRSVDRDAQTDRSRISSVLRALESALRDAEQEQSGLKQRVQNVLAREAESPGNAGNENVGPEGHDSYNQELIGSEIVNGQRRLQELATEITHFKFLRAATLSRFPDHRPASGN